jgi:hypothetical protein
MTARLISVCAPFRPRSKKRGVAEDLVFEGGEGVFHRASSQSHFVRRRALLHAAENFVVKMTGQGTLRCHEQFPQSWATAW